VPVVFENTSKLLSVAVAKKSNGMVAFPERTH